MHKQKWVAFIIIGMVVASFVILMRKNSIKLGLDLKGGADLVLEIDTAKLPEGSSVSEAQERAIEVIRNRIDALGVSEPVIQKEGEKWIVVQLPGLQDQKRAIELVGKTALLEFKLLDETGDISAAVAGKVPEGDQLLYDKEKRPFLVKKEQLLTGATLTDAKVIPSGAGQFNNEPYVSIQFNDEGAKKFGEITGNNVGKRLAIVLDDMVYSAPVIKTAIPDGKAIIEGSFTFQSAKDLAVVLRAGALPAPITIISNNIIGPSLGSDSIKKGQLSVVLGTVLVILFMGIYYRKSGIIADFALLANLIFLLASLSLLNATLTLPGIAGIALTMGMSVDSNVLIFERIREELRTGKTIRASVDAGYRHALVTIIDSHVTTLITSAVLFQFGSGPIKGFAVTLSFGVAISLFTALVITKMIFDWRLETTEVTRLSI